MKYLDIKTSDINNGEGVRVSLWVSGCPHRCKGCHNPESWNYNHGEEFTVESMQTILNAMGTPMEKHFSVLGGEPLVDKNYDSVVAICRTVKLAFPERNIWLWTGYTKEELERQGKTEIFRHIDKLIDGRYVQEEADKSLLWHGSKNQRIIDLNEQ